VIHRVREAAGEPQGALVLLHGRGADEHDLQPVLDVLDERRRLVGLTPGAPLTNVPPGGRHWYVILRVGFPDPDTFAATYAELTGFLDGWLAERGIGWERTVLGGFSQGAVMAYATALGPDRPSPAGLLAMSGFIPTVDGWAPELGSRRDLPVLIAHGARDAIISVDFARDARRRLEDGGLSVAYHESAAAHHIDPRTVPALQAWVSDRL
jgi:phospholipase/carboxylesterase